MAKTDLEIAQECVMEPIEEVAKKVGIQPDMLENYGKYKAKLSFDFLRQIENNEPGKLILVTAINPTKAGEGKSTTTVGLGDALNRLGKKTMMALREPSLGPVFGLKGGATGGGYAQVVPMEDINLHFTGDMHAITTANNLVSAILDNHLHQGNELNIDPEKITFKRCLDMNDRTLRNINIGQGPKANGVERNDGFNITVASEIMAALCLADDLMDLKKRFGQMLVAYTYDDKPVYVHDLGIEGALAMVMKDAILPNVVQTLEHNPVLIHGGPFANIAHGCNSVIATKACLRLADYTVTEAGFGADLGAEKFLDIKCRLAKLNPSAVVIVATIRALKQHGGIELENLKEENVEAMLAGCENLAKHIDTIKQFGLPYIVLRMPKPYDTTTLNYNWQIWETDAYSLYTTTTEQIDEESSRNMISSILRFMSNNGMIVYPLEGKQNSKVFRDEELISVRPRTSGTFRNKTTVGQLVKKGEILAWILDTCEGNILEELKAPVDGKIFFQFSDPLVYANTAAIKILPDSI